MCGTVTNTPPPQHRLAPPRPSKHLTFMALRAVSPKDSKTMHRSKKELLITNKSNNILGRFLP